MIDIKNIKDPTFLKKLDRKQLECLAKDIRQFLIENVSKTGGHLSSNLGVVELTLAMHYVFDSPQDKFIFDVGHQCYTHKILTGRAKDFDKLRKFGGISGFIKKDESEHDIWESGHSSTSISAQCGYLLSQEDYSEDKVVVLIGDSSVSNGVAFEALNYMGTLKGKSPIIILNDNKMSISKSVGSISRSFSKLRSTRFYQKVNGAFARFAPKFIKFIFRRFKNSIKGLILKENIFEDWGYDYMGPYDGNDLSVCLKTLQAAKNLNKPCVIHFVTKKGKGYLPAEQDKTGNYHGIGPFDIESGETQLPNVLNFPKVMSQKIEHMICEEARYVITPAMIKGSYLTELQQKYPQNIIDVGMAEEHAAVMASSLAQAGKKVVLMLYSTFAQRAYDYVLNDIARTKAPLIIAIDHADIVSGDGETHQGIYDLAMWSSMPNIQVVMPKDGDELVSLMDYASKEANQPIVIRYHKDETTLNGNNETILEPSWTIEKEGNDAIIITYGNNVNYVLDAIKDSIRDIKVVNARFIKPFDKKMFAELIEENKPIIVYENCIYQGSLSSALNRYVMDNKLHVNLISMCLEDDVLIPCGDIESIKKHLKISKEDIFNKVEEIFE